MSMKDIWTKVNLDNAESKTERLEKDVKSTVENEKLDIDPYRIDNEINSILEN